jgi:hypothetical protein
MTSNYYYLVAGLPEVLFDEGKQFLSCREFLLEAEEQLSERDLRLLNLLRSPFDNSNLLSLLLKTERPFDVRGSLSEETLTQGLKFPDELPQYMQRFLEAHHENRSPAPGLTQADLLAWFFYEEMAQEENGFIREWFSFDLQLRNVVAGINCRKELDHLEELATEREKPLAAVIVGRDEVAEALLRSNAPDFGLTVMVPWADRLFALSRGPMVEFEKGIDTLRWDILDEMTIASHFRAETVFSFFIKLTIVERWMALDPETGKEKLERLLDEITSSYSVPVNF